MSVVAMSPRPYPSPRSGRPSSLRRRPVAGPQLTITLDLVPGTGPVPAHLARLIELIGELAGAAQEGVQVSVADRPTARSAAPPEPVAAVGLLPVDAEPVDPAPGQPVERLQILAGTRVVRLGDRVLALTRIEFDLLLFLAEHPRQVFTRLQLLSNVWGYEHAVARTVDVHVRRLRAKAGPDVPLVTTVYGVGYRLASEAQVIIDRHQ